MKCPHCATRVLTNSAFCHRCGQPLLDPATHSVPPPLHSARRNRREPLGEPGDTAGETEYTLWRGTYSAKGMVDQWLTACLVTLALPIGTRMAGADATVWLALAGLLAALWLALLCLLVWRKLNVSYVLTTQRFSHQLGFLTRYTHRIELIDIDDVSFRQGILERLLGVGTIVIDSSDRTDPVLVMPGIDAVPLVAEMIDDARRAERLRRGLYVEAI